MSETNAAIPQQILGAIERISLAPRSMLEPVDPEIFSRLGIGYISQSDLEPLVSSSRRTIEQVDGDRLVWISDKGTWVEINPNTCKDVQFVSRPAIKKPREERRTIVYLFNGESLSQAIGTDPYLYVCSSILDCVALISKGYRAVATNDVSSVVDGKGNVVLIHEPFSVGESDSECKPMVEYENNVQSLRAKGCNVVRSVYVPNGSIFESLKNGDLEQYVRSLLITSEHPTIGTSEPKKVRYFADDFETLSLMANDPNHRPVSTGNKAIDNALHGGLGRGKLYTIAAPPSYGKTALAVQIAFDIAKQGQPVLYIALESTKKHYMLRTLSHYSFTEHDVVVPYGDMEDCKVDMPSEIVSELVSKDYPLRFVCRNDLENNVHSIDVSEIEKQYMQLDTECGTHPVLVVDYLQKLDASSDDPTNESRRIKEHLAVLDSISKRYDVPVLVLSAVNRGDGYDEHKSLENLAGSSKIEYDVDVALFLEPECAAMGKELVHEELNKPERKMVLYSPKDRAHKRESVVLNYRCDVGAFRGLSEDPAVSSTEPWRNRGCRKRA